MMHLPASDAEDGYRELIAAIVARAVADAQGDILVPGLVAPDHIMAEARAWLAAEAGPRDLVELCGHDSTAVLARIRQVLQAPAPVIAQSQLSLFGATP